MAGMLWLVMVMAFPLGSFTAQAGEEAFVRPAAAECEEVRAVAEKTFGKPFVLDADAPFVYGTEDAVGLLTETTGRGCLLLAKGTGVDFPNLPGAEDEKLERALAGWTAVTDNARYAGYGTLGGASALTRGNSVMVIEVGWEVTPRVEAIVAKKCPEMPIYACTQYIKPKDRHYTFAIHIAVRAR